MNINHNQRVTELVNTFFESTPVPDEDIDTLLSNVRRAAAETIDAPTQKAQDAHLNLEPIKERLAAATPGPLGFATAPAEDSSESPAEYIANALTGDGELYVVWDTSTEGDPEGYVLTAVTGDGPHASANAKLYAHAPSDLAALIAEVEQLRGQVDEFATLWKVATDAVNLDTDASLGEWQTAFDGLVAKYHESGYRAGGQDSLTENTVLRAQIEAVRAAVANHSDGDTVSG